MKLPNPELAVVDIVKLRAYCLSPTHLRGRHKARVFSKALDILAADAEELRALLLSAARMREAVAAGEDRYGARYVIDFPVTKVERQAMVRSAWIVRSGEVFARLTSCYVL